MKSIKIFIIASLFSPLTYAAVTDTADKVESHKQLMEILTNKDKQKELFCGLVAFNAHSVYGLATNGMDIPKSSVESIMEMDSFADDSLHYELIRIAIDDGYKKIPSEITYKKIMTYCTSKTFEQVSDMDIGRQEVLDDEAWQKAWEEAQCDERSDSLSNAFNASFEGESETKIRGFLKSAKNSTLENRMYKALLLDGEGMDRQLAFEELTYEFEDYCGQGELN